MTPVHATTVARFDPDGWRAVLLTGPSGAGKSDLALRLIGRGWRLVADDYSHVWRSGERVYATAPKAIAGRIEARGMGIVTCPPRFVARVVMVIACVHETPDRLPDPAFETVAGLTLPRLVLDTRPASTVETVAAAVGRLQRTPALNPRGFPLSRPACGPDRSSGFQERVAGSVVW